MNELVLTVGLPRSGKSTWAKNQNLPIVSRDSIRLALYNHPYIQEMEDFVSFMEDKMVDSLFLAGNKKIIIDATHLKLKYIERWQKKDPKCMVTAMYFYTKDYECKKRAIADGKEYLVDVIDRMIEQTDLHHFKSIVHFEHYTSNGEK